MEITSTALTALTSTTASLPRDGNTATAGVNSFGQVLADALGGLQQSQTEADTLASAFAAGHDIELHEVMLALEQASLATQVTVQVRNKLIEAYQEISRMQV